MKYAPQSSITGGWVDKATLTSGMKAKIVSEAKPVPSAFKDDKGNPQEQNVAKVHFQGQSEPVNVNLNRTTINGLISAFGEDSVNWQGHHLTIEVEKTRVGGRAVTALYFIPEGYEKVDDEEGFAVIQKKSVKDVEPPVVDDTIDPKDLPF